MKIKLIFLFCFCLILVFSINGCNKNATIDQNDDTTSNNEFSNDVHSESSYIRTFESFDIKIGASPYPLSGVLCLPDGIMNPPIVIMVQGSGQSDYNETIYENTPFKDIAEGLAKQGVASIRYNKRYYQYPQTAPANITIEDEVLNDVNNAISFSLENENTKNSKIYILGHSLGGSLAPYIAQTNANVAGIISLAGTPRHLEDVILDQNIAAVNAMTDKTDDEKKALIDEVQKNVNMVKELHEGDPSINLFYVPSSYWLSLKKIDNITICKELDTPMLILQGSADFQVYPEIDYTAWQDILKNKSNVKFQLYDALNHLFMRSNGRTDLSEYEIKGKVEELVMNDIAKWIFEETGNSYDNN